ncbi:MAG: glycoside hydrolase family 99-like domain-containing protein [Verrucomicrobiota bacterium]
MKSRIQITVLLMLASLVQVRAGEPLVQEWVFTQESARKEWTANGHIKDVKPTRDGISFRTEGSDPIFTLQTMLNVPATPWQMVEICLKADHDGVGELFWSNTQEGKYGGFTSEKVTRYTATGGTNWQTIRLLPFWQTEKRIMRLRLDVYDGTRFELASIRIVDLMTDAAPVKPDFDFTQGGCGWLPLDGATGTTNKLGVIVGLPTSRSFFLSPAVQFSSEDAAYLAVRLAATKGRTGKLYFATDQSPGWQTVAFPITADGRPHTYNLDMLTVEKWRGRIVALGLRPTDATNTASMVNWLRVGTGPQGSAQIQVLSFGLDEALPRVGGEYRILAHLVNTGGAPLTGLQAELTLPKGAIAVVKPLHGALTNQLAFGETLDLAWRFKPAAPISGDAVLRLTASAANPVTTQAPMRVTPTLRLEKASYVPEPKPVRGPYEVGAYYYPGWQDASRWQPLQNFPERKPVLGWYAEGSPEVADWHIKWAVEHGITFFAYDWYWSQGARHNEHGLHDGYFKARYRNLLKFCLLWANHNPKNTSSQADCLAVTRYWITNYFKRPEHLTVEGKPVMIIFSEDRLASDLGVEGVKTAFEAMRAECRQAGLPGLYLVTCVNSVGQARRAAQQGYDAVSAYNWPHLGAAADEKAAPYSTLIGGYYRQWQHIVSETAIPLMLPICGGWDSRPWHGDNALVRYERTPELFRQHLLDARSFMDQVQKPSPVTRFALVEAWNEWGEGSYIEPHQQYGFSYLDAIREVFSGATNAHVDFGPADVGMGPYEVPTMEPSKTAWEFTQATEVWNSHMHLDDVKVVEGALTGRSVGNDPAFFSPPLKVQSAQFGKIQLRMKLTDTTGQGFKDQGQMFWSTARLHESEATSMRFEVAGDGQWHDYEVPVSQSKRWQGTITRLRLDPCNRAGVQIAVDYLRLVK